MKVLAGLAWICLLLHHEAKATVHRGRHFVGLLSNAVDESVGKGWHGFVGMMGCRIRARHGFSIRASDGEIHRTIEIHQLLTRRGV